ncbi:hypothetical protein IT570_09315 [Candidatus Sumerlaeota bacterium]|nr:hypothetical protein [Candidatus Sumerlaeota bacterium]
MVEGAVTANGTHGAVVSCRQCGTPNEPPFIFCHQCGAARVSLNRYQVLANLTLATAAFTLTYYYAEELPWAWPLYALYALLFAQFALLLVVGSRARTTRIGSWIAVFLGGFGALFHLLNVEGPQLFIYLLEDLPSIIRKFPYESLGVLIAVLLLPALILYRRWGRIYGWVNAYRIVVLSFLGLVVGCLGALQVLKVATTNAWFPTLQAELTKFVTTVKPQYTKALSVTTVTLLRLFLFEIFVFAAVRGYRTATKVAPVAPLGVRGQSGFERSLVSLARVVRIFGAVLENMITYLLETIIVLSKDAWQVLKIACREVFFPASALIICALFLHQLTRFTLEYIAHNDVRTALLIGASTVAIILCELLFLICKTAFRPSRVLDFHMQMLGWLLPNLLVFFLLVSLSLFGLAEALNDDTNKSHALPFALGMLTKFFGIVLVLLVGVVLVRKRTLFTMQPPTQESAESHDPTTRVRVAQVDAEEDSDDGIAALEATINGGTPALAQPLPSASVSPLLFSRRKNQEWDLSRNDQSADQNVPPAIGAITSRLKDAVTTNPIAANARKAVETLQDRMMGRPEIVQRLIEAKREYAEKYYQLEALERTKDTIQGDTYRGLRERYLAELNSLLANRDQLQAELDRLYAMQMVEKNMLDIRISALHSKKEELEHLRSVGAVSEKDLKAGSVPLENELRMEIAKLQSCEQKLTFLKPEATAYSEVERTGA